MHPAEELIDQKAQLSSSSCLNKLCQEGKCRRPGGWEGVLDGEWGREENDVKWIQQEIIFFLFFFLLQLLSFFFFFLCLSFSTCKMELVTFPS